MARSKARKQTSPVIRVILSIIVLFLVSCSEEEVRHGFCLNGVWELQSVTSPEGYDYDYPTGEMTWMRIYDDSCYYMCQVATAPNGTMITPEVMANYTFIEKGQDGNLYIQANNTYPLTVENDSMMVIQEYGRKYTWKLRKDFDEERKSDIVGIIKSDVKNNGGVTHSYVFSKAEKALETTNHTLVYILTAIVVGLLIFINYVHHLYQNKKRIEQELRRIEEEHNTMPESVRKALSTVETDFHQSEFYLSIHKRIACGERLKKDDWDAIETHIKSVYPGFTHSLISLYRMSQVELQVCLLLKMNATPSEIATVLCKDPSSISTVRSRLYQKIFGKKGSSKEWDEFIHSL